MPLAAEVTMFGYVLVMLACIGISNTECQKFEFAIASFYIARLYCRLATAFDKLVGRSSTVDTPRLSSWGRTFGSH